MTGIDLYNYFCSLAIGRCVYCVLRLCRCTSSVTTSVARMEVWVLSYLLMVVECR